MAVIKVKKIKTKTGVMYAIVISKWLGLITRVYQTHFSLAYAEDEARYMARKLKLQYVLI